MAQQVAPLCIEKRNTPHLDISLQDVELTEESAHFYHPCVSFLKQHQYHVLHRMLQLEKGIVRITSANKEKEISTRVGFLMDDVGHGKSYSVLALIKYDMTTRQDNAEDDIPDFYTYGRTRDSMVVQKTRQVRPIFIDTNIIVVPSHVISQWQTYTAAIFPPDTPYMILSNTRQLPRFQSKPLHEYAFLVMSNTFYRNWRKALCRENSALLHHVCIKRFIVDEENTLSSLVPLIKSQFVWIMTADMSILNRMRMNGAVCTKRTETYFRRCLTDMILNDIDPLSCVARANPDFVQRSFQLPGVISHLIQCKAPFSVNVLNGLVYRGVIEALNANDVHAAARCLGIHSMTEENIVRVSVQKFERDIANLEQLINFHQHVYVHPSEDAKKNTLAQLERQKKDFIHSINCIRERIEKEDMCSICYSDFEHKTVVRCCMNSFCFKCLSVWMMKNESCPLCKRIIDRKKDIIRISSGDESGESSQQKQEAEANEAESYFSPENNKNTNLTKLLHLMTPQSKILLFSSYDGSDIHHRATRVLEEKRIKYKFVKGNLYQIQHIISDFKQSDLNVLVLNTQYLASGMNLENTTDIIITHRMRPELEKQIIGRGQRFGRRTPLHVWYLYNQNEML